MTDKTYNDIQGEYRLALRADLLRLDVESELATLQANAPVYDAITPENIEQIMTHKAQVQMLQSEITAQTNLIRQKAKIITSWLSSNDFPPDQIWQLPFDDDSTVAVRIILANGNYTIDHSLNPASELYTEPAP